jgi:hypothetical protein
VEPQEAGNKVVGVTQGGERWRSRDGSGIERGMEMELHLVRETMAAIR